MTEDTETIGGVPITPRARTWYRRSRWGFRLIGFILLNIRVTGRENVPPGNYIVVANHLNWIDPFLLVMYLPAEPRVCFIGAQGAVNRGWKDRMLARFDILIPVRRGAAWLGRDVLEKPKEVLSAGAVLGIFPEGKLGPSEGDMLPLERGIGHIVVSSGFPVLPVAISGVQELYFRKPVTVTIGKPLRVVTEGLNHRAAIDATVQQVDRAIREILPPYQEPRPRIKLMRFLTRLLDLGQPEPEWQAGPPGSAAEASPPGPAAHGGL